VSITNNIIVNNLAGWDGAGISLQDALNVSIVNNTIAHNDSLASSGVLTQSIGTPQASAPAGNCTLTGPTGANTASCPQPAGVSSTLNSSLLTTTFTGLTITCPAGQSATGCLSLSNPIFNNNIIWQNRSFQIGISSAGTGNLNQQNLVSLYNASFGGTGVGRLAPAQTATGQCSTGSSYWDIGVRGDTGPNNHGSGGRLSPTHSVLSSGGEEEYGETNSHTPPPVISQYCNGSRVPPECTVADGCGGPSGYGVPPGIADATTPNPVFSLTPSATVDEGNNWINISWGPLALTNPALLGPANPGATGGDYGGGPALANYSLSRAIDSISASVPHPATDFFGNPRPETGGDRHFDPGAVEFTTVAAGGLGGTLSFTSATNGTLGSALGVNTLTFAIPTPRAAVTSVVTVTNTGSTPLSITAEALAMNIGGLYSITAQTCTTASPLAVGGTCTVSIQYATPTTPPMLPTIGLMTATNSGSGTVGGVTSLVLLAQ